MTDDEIREELREAGETDEDIETFVAEGGADRVRDDLRMKKALDRIAAEVQADRARVARGAREHLDAGAGAGGRDTETLDPR